MRRVPATALLAVNRLGVAGGPDMGGRFSPALVVDEATISEPPSAAFRSGRFNRVPVLRGTNHDEYAWLLGLEELDTGVVLTPDLYVRRLQREFGDSAPSVLERYAVAAFGSASYALTSALTDGLYISVDRECSAALARFVNIYTYQFDVPRTEIATPPVSFEYRSAHTAELPYLFPGFCGASGRVGGGEIDLARPESGGGRPVAEHGVIAASGGINLWVPASDESASVVRLANQGIGVAPGSRSSRCPILVVMSG